MPDSAWGFLDGRIFYIDLNFFITFSHTFLGAVNAAPHKRFMWECCKGEAG